ncbi:hypothetical protein L1049_003123 [Liquidambar formosana]|uniref:Uncharacterized protein n=1 Tax=Liquidambar formosana TaxID=63359 RepID=A0AAP0R9H5_LIQFO
MQAVSQTGPSYMSSAASSSETKIVVHRSLFDAEIFSLDAKCSPEGWKKCLSRKTSMETISRAALIDGMVYITSDHYRTRRRMGAIDPCCNDWKPLPELPSDLCPDANGMTMHVVLDGGQQILFYDKWHQVAYSYNVGDQSWKLFEENFGYWNCQAAVVGNTMEVEETVDAGKGKLHDHAMAIDWLDKYDGLWNPKN